MHSLVQTEAVMDTIVHSVLSNTRSIDPMGETFAKMVDEFSDEHRLRHKKKNLQQLLTNISQ